MDIISFFRSIDGLLYYVLLVVNTVLIFAIIGYLGEKNNEKFIKMGLKTNIPNPSGGLNLTPVSMEKHSDASIPTVSPTMVNNQVLENVLNSTVQPDNFVNSNWGTNTGNQNGMFVNSVAINNMDNNVNMTPSVINQGNNEIDPNEKAPAVLVINSDNTNMPK